MKHSLNNFQFGSSNARENIFRRSKNVLNLSHTHRMIKDGSTSKQCSQLGQRLIKSFMEIRNTTSPHANVPAVHGYCIFLKRKSCFILSVGNLTVLLKRMIDLLKMAILTDMWQKSELRHRLSTIKPMYSILQKRLFILLGFFGVMSTTRYYDTETLVVLLINELINFDIDPKLMIS